MSYPINNNENRQNNMRLAMQPNNLTRPNIVNEPDSFLYKYRWWVVFGLVVLLVYYLNTQKCMEQRGGVLLDLTMRGGGAPVQTFAGLDTQSPLFNTEHRSLFGL